MRLNLSLELVSYDRLAVQVRSYQATTRRMAHTSYIRYGGARTRYETVPNTVVVRTETTRAAEVPRLCLEWKGRKFALSPFGEFDEGDLQRIQRLYKAKSVSSEEWFYWDYNIRVKASAPWRYGLDDFRRLTY